MTAQKTYERLERHRQPYLRRARAAAKVTIPSLFPEEGANHSTDYPTPYQSIGARGLNTVSNKIVLSVLPANVPFFKLGIDDYSLKEVAGDEKARAQVEEGLNKVERAVMNEIESNLVRVTLAEGVKQLVLAGNVLIRFKDDGTQRAYRLDQYVVRRDPYGNLLEIVCVEHVDPKALDEAAKPLLGANPENSDEAVEVYTHVYREDGQWKTYQELKDQVIPGTEGSYPLKKLPWIALRFNKVDGEHYGRGYVEEYMGDLMTLEELSKAVTQGAAAAAKILLFVRPNGVTQVKTITDTPNMGVVYGDAADVSVLQMEKYADFRVALQMIQDVEKRLGHAFMLAAGATRDAERVTAAEIHLIAGELDDNLGGLYSILSKDLQIPIVTSTMYRMQKQKRLPQLPEGVVNPQITSGIEALGRGHELQKMGALIQHIAPLIQADPTILKDYFTIGDYIKRVGTSLGIDLSGLVRSEQEAQQLRQRREIQAMQAAAAPAMMPTGKQEA